MPKIHSQKQTFYNAWIKLVKSIKRVAHAIFWRNARYTMMRTKAPKSTETIGLLNATRVVKVDDSTSRKPFLRFAKINDKVFIANGQDPIIRFDGNKK